MSVSKAKATSNIKHGGLTCISSNTNFIYPTGGGISSETNNAYQSGRFEYKYNSYTPAEEVNSPALSTDTVVGANNTEVTKLYTGVPKAHHVIGGVAWGYNGTPASGYFTVENGSGNFIFRQPITAAGAGFYEFDPPKRFDLNTDVFFKLSAPGPGVSGYISVLEHWVK